jgi:uncharacterized protein with HEPN domain
VKDQRVYLLHAVDAIDAILDYTADGREGFFADRKTQDAVIRQHRDPRPGSQGSA